MMNKKTAAPTTTATATAMSMGTCWLEAVPEELHDREKSDACAGVGVADLMNAREEGGEEGERKLRAE